MIMMLSLSLTAMHFKNSRSASIDDITEPQLALLHEVITGEQDPEITARIADILWIRRRDFRMAELAVKSYLASAEILKLSRPWIVRTERIERAVGLAASLGLAGPLFAQVIEYVEGLLNEIEGNDSSLFSARLMELLQGHKKGSPTKYAEMAGTAALRAEAEHDWNRSRTYWEVKAGWHALGNDADKRARALICAAESYVKDATDFINQTPPSYISASAQIQRAIVALRRVAGTNSRVDSLHKLLMDYEEKTNLEMKSSSQSVDFGRYIEVTREQITGKSFSEALLTLAFMFSHPSVADLRLQVLEHVEDFGFRDLLCVVEVVNERGKVVGRKPSFVSEDPLEVEKAIQAEMFSNAKRVQWMYAHAFIEPARIQINLEHREVRLRDFMSMVTNNPFVPEGREDIYARGLYAGLKGDFMTAIHLLLPQLENSIRHELELQNLIVSGLDQSNIQKEYDLNKLFEIYFLQLVSIFGEDLIFDLRGLLIERFGSNLRNRMAHGLISAQKFSSPNMVYVWWLALRLCLVPLARSAYQACEPKTD
jgi:hypothetical protein